MKIPSYEPLVEALKKPLPERVEDRETLRQMVAFAESYGIIVSEHRRQLLVQYEIEKEGAWKSLRAGVGINEEGLWSKTEEQAEAFRKLNADEKKLLIDAEIAKTAAELDFVTNLENLIKRRCSVGQSISNSFNTETSSQYNN